MTAPRWIRDSIDGQWAGNDVDDKDAEEFARELMEHLPIEAMVSAAATGPETDASIPLPLRVIAARRFVTSAIRAMTSDPEVVTLTELYRDACTALDAAGVPYAASYADDGDVQEISLNLSGRIRWLAQQRPSRLELQRIVEERDQARRALIAAQEWYADELAKAAVEQRRQNAELQAVLSGMSRRDD